jgi:hypothetical protein
VCASLPFPINLGLTPLTSLAGWACHSGNQNRHHHHTPLLDLQLLLLLPLLALLLQQKPLPHPCC